MDGTYGRVVLGLEENGRSVSEVRFSRSTSTSAVRRW